MTKTLTFRFENSTDLHRNMAILERNSIIYVLKKTHGNIEQSIKMLNVQRNTLRYYMKKHGIDVESYRPNMMTAKEAREYLGITSWYFRKMHYGNFIKPDKKVGTMGYYFKSTVDKAFKALPEDFFKGSGK